MKGDIVDFTDLIMLEYMTKVCNMPRNLPLSYPNLLTHIFKVFNAFFEDEECQGKIP